ncbi:MAG: alpha/beta hydrolase [Firmicutes bacterium]|nr:alpha/beta hydrolase [Bacillota bacterium]
MDIYINQNLDHYAISKIPEVNTEHIRNKILNVPYADQSSSQKLDIYLPDTKGPFPVIVSIHGGAFMGGDKADVQLIPMLEGLKKGYAVVSINYRLSHQAVFPALIYDGKAAIRWIRANSEKYGFNPDRIAAWGGSAGGYLSSFLGVSAGVEELEDLSMGNDDYSSNIQAAVVWFGPTNFLLMDQQLEESGLLAEKGKRHSEINSPESLFLGEKITNIPGLVKKANPETYITENTPLFLLQHGTKDSTVPVQQSIEFAEKLKKELGSEKITLDLLEGAEHADQAFETEENLEIVFNFLDRVLKS